MRRWSFHPGLVSVVVATALMAGCNSAGSPYAHANGGAASLPPDGTDVLGGAVSPAARCILDNDLDAMVQQLLTLVNIERARVGVAPLTGNDELTSAAEDYACVMAAEDFFAHTHPVTGEGPGERAAEAGYAFFAVGENLAAGHHTASAALEGWMNSPDHRHNLLSPEWKETGIGVRGGGTYGIYWVQEFGKPASIAHQPVIVDGALTVNRE